MSTKKSIIIENETITYALDNGIYYSQLSFTPLDGFPFTIYKDNVVQDDPTVYHRVGKTVTWVGTPSGTIVAKYSRVSTEAASSASPNISNPGGDGNTIQSMAGTAIVSGSGISIVGGTITNTASFTLQNDQVKSQHIDAKAVTNQAIDDFAVDTQELANLAVEETKIANDAVTFLKLQNLDQHEVIGRYNSGVGNPTNISVETSLTGGVNQLAYSDAIKTYVDQQISQFKPRYIALQGMTAATSSTGSNWWTQTLNGRSGAIMIRNNHAGDSYSDGSAAQANQRPSVTFALSAFLSPVESNFYTKILYLHGRCTHRVRIPNTTSRVRVMWRAQHGYGGNDSNSDMHLISGTEHTYMSAGGTETTHQTTVPFVLPITPYQIAQNAITFNIDKVGTGGQGTPGQNSDQTDHSFIHLFGATLVG